VENLKMLAHNMALYSATSLPDAFRMTQSDASDFFDGKAWAEWRKGREQELKLQAGIGDRLNNVIRACGVIAKAIAALGRR